MNKHIKTPPGREIPGGAQEVDDSNAQPNMETPAEQITVPCIQRSRLHTALSVLAVMHDHEAFVVCAEGDQPGYMILEVWPS